jgi:anti-sigma regulatory factor (Ser/Thr protein kinase)
MTVLGSVVLPGIEPAVAVVRRFARTAVGPAFPGLYELTVVASELFGNAVRHSRSGRRSGADGVGQVTVTLLTGDGLLRLEVADQGGEGVPRLRTPEDGGESGRGLHVVEALATDWGAEPDGARTVVWAEFAWPGRCTVPQAGSRGA